MRRRYIGNFKIITDDNINKDLKKFVDFLKDTQSIFNFKTSISIMQPEPFFGLTVSVDTKNITQRQIDAGMDKIDSLSRTYYNRGKLKGKVKIVFTMWRQIDEDVSYMSLLLNNDIKGGV